MARQNNHSMDKCSQWIKTSTIVFLDILVICISQLLGLFIRYGLDFTQIPKDQTNWYVRFMPLIVVVSLAMYFAFGMYHFIWHMMGIKELLKVNYAFLLLIPVYALIAFLTGNIYSRTALFIGYTITFFLTYIMRFSLRIKQEIFGNRVRAGCSGRIMLIGAGETGRALIKGISDSGAICPRVCCVIDDNPQFKGRRLEGVKVVGNRYDIPEMCRKYNIDKIVFAISDISPEEKKKILNICKKTPCALKTVPRLSQMVNGEISFQRIRDVEISDLLGREQVVINNEEVIRSLKGKRVMVTGVGSIGSELCRQVAATSPDTLIMFDIYENNLFDIEQELKRKYPDLKIVAIVGSVRDDSRVRDVFDTHRPEIVFHAAAHKHVPLMEGSPNEAVKNNVYGTWNLAAAAAEYKVEKFLLISTDKAVNPTNIMGASKRICEMIIQMMSRRHPETSFVAVRFGNVLGSNGSVVPLFEKQIAEGGPVTVTDPRIIRYFMTISEAVSLILQAVYYAKGGEIFVLDMGEPVLIDEMARNLIRLAGYIPDVDIRIEYTGLRPGEKLYEELLMNEEGLKDTANKRIFIGRPIEFDDRHFEEQLHMLDEASSNETDHIREIVTGLVPTYHYEKNA